MKTPENVKEFLRKIGRKGGKASRAALTPEQRSEQARRAIKARWAKAKEAKQ